MTFILYLRKTNSLSNLERLHATITTCISLTTAEKKNSSVRSIIILINHLYHINSISLLFTINYKVLIL